MSLNDRVEESLVGIPSNPFDVPGFITPGATVLLSIFVFESWVRSILPAGDPTPDIHTPVFRVIQIFLEKFHTNTQDWVFAFLFIIILAGVAYILGHIISTMSTFVLSRMYGSKAFDYPYIKLLNLEPERGNELKKPFYKGMFFWLNCYFVARYCELFYYGLDDYTFEHDLISMFARAIGVLIVLSVVAKTIASAKYKEHQIGFLFTFVTTQRWLFDRVDLFLVKYFPFFTDRLGKVVSQYVRKKEHLSPEFIQCYSKHFWKAFGIKYTRAESDNFWLSYFYLRHQSSVFGGMATRLLRLYVLARNLSMSFYVTFLYCYTWLLMHRDVFPSFNLNLFQKRSLLWVPLIYFVLAFLMYFRYYYLRVPYFSKFVFRAFVCLRQIEKQTSKSAARSKMVSA